MRVTRSLVAGIAAAAAIGAFAAPVGAHPDSNPNNNVCALVALPAQVNSVEEAGSSHTKATGNNGWWKVTVGSSVYQTDMDLTAARVSGTGALSITIGGHAGQAVNQGRYGLYYPPTDPDGSHATLGAGDGWAGAPNWAGDHFNWQQTGTCANNGASFSAQGTGVGYCGRSVGLGAGTAAGHNTIIRWESFGTQLIFNDPSANGSVNAQGNVPGSPNGSCASGTATTFLVDGTIVHG